MGLAIVSHDYIQRGNLNLKPTSVIYFKFLFGSSFVRFAFPLPQLPQISHNTYSELTTTQLHHWLPVTADSAESSLTGITIRKKPRHHVYTTAPVPTSDTPVTRTMVDIRHL